MTIAKLAGSIYGNVLTINDMLEHFERSVKPNFKDSSERSYIKVWRKKGHRPEAWNP